MKIRHLLYFLAGGLLIGVLSAQAPPHCTSEADAKRDPNCHFDPVKGTAVYVIPIAETPKVPTISDTLRAKFWKAQSALSASSAQVQAAEDRLKAAQKAAQETVDELTKVCGKDASPQMVPAAGAPDADVACVAKSEKK